MSTKIPWVRNPDGSAGESWNPVRGCSPVSPGCEHCYAARIASRFSGPGNAYDGLATTGGKWTGEINIYPQLFDRPRTWRKPRTVFVNSMSDLFHENIPFEALVPIFNTIRGTPRHRYIILTKRPKRMAEFFAWYSGAIPIKDKLLLSFRHMWLGVTAENQAMADERIPILINIPATLHFVSIEPMLEAIDISYMPANQSFDGKGGPVGSKRLIHAIDWVICGCESGHGARTFNVGWAEYLRDQCIGAGVPFFFKQARGPNGEFIEMPKLDFKLWDQIPEVK